VADDKQQSEARRVERQVAVSEAAEDKREEREEREAERHAAKVSVPDDSGPPQVKIGRDGERTYPVSRLTGPDGAVALGHPVHVIVGALTNEKRAYISLEDARTSIDNWLSGSQKEA
jgi:hypothetical protein